MTLAASIQEEVVREAARAPSVHNIQPARWRFADDGVTLFRALDRTLPVADPTGHDLRASLGAAFEGMAIALSTRGFALGHPERSEGSVFPQEQILRYAQDDKAPVVTASITQSDTGADPLAPYVQLRHSFRGRFTPATAQEIGALTAAIQAPDAIVAIGSALADLAPMHDAATWAFESKPEYHAELWHWLRLSKRDPRYMRDGLNGDCLALSPLEQWAAARLLKPPMFARLKSIGVARALVSEATQVKSASAAVLFTPRVDLDPFDVGRRMYRLWLEITRAGFHLTPMSASADHRETREQLAARFKVPADRRIANVFRVGRTDASAVAISPRLPISELLV